MKAPKEVDAKELMEMVFEALHRERGIERVQDYADAGIWSSGNGIVVTMDSGAQFNVTITRIRHAPGSRAAVGPKGCRWAQIRRAVVNRRTNPKGEPK